jgi:cysteine desulfurase
LVTDLPIYLDHQATTPVDPRVLEAMLPVFREDFGNAASHTHRYGWRAEALVEVAREQVAAAIGARDPREIIFTSGATEADNLALRGALRAHRGRGDRVVTVETEHPAVLETCRALATEGFRSAELPVDGEGALESDALAALCDPGTVLVSVMAANNEIGALPPLAEIGALCAERDVLFHSDAAQAVGKIPLDVEALGIDLLSISAHKMYGPKGVGALYVRRRRRSGQRLRLDPILTGGGHERGLRPGTLPVPGIVGFGVACAIAEAEREAEAQRLLALRERLLAALRGALPGVALNGPERERLPGNLNVSFERVEADALLPRLEDLALSSGSACSSANPEPSHVLRALGLPEDRVRGAIRIGLGRHTSQDQVDRAAQRIAREVERLRAEAGAVATGTGPR